MNYIEIKAPAKINIGLDILEKRFDGFHNLSTLFYPIIDLYDVLTFRKADIFSFSCSDPTLGQDSSNLVVRAKNILESYCGKKINVKIKLTKNIPSQAGLGGGSSDAATTLISLNEMFELNLKYEQLVEAALELGSDVPFFIKAKPAVGSSRGEILEYIDLEIQESILIVNPGIHISTAAAFQNVVPLNYPTDYKVIIESGKLNYTTLRQSVKNDFEFYVFSTFPVIKEIKEIMYANNALFSLMSGSGSTVYGIFKNKMDALRVSEKLNSDYFIYLCNTEEVN